MDIASARAILGVSEHSTLNEVRAAFRMRAALLHPDKHQHAGEDLSVAATTAMQQLNDAYQTVIAALPRPSPAQSPDPVASEQQTTAWANSEAVAKHQGGHRQPPSGREERQPERDRKRSAVRDLRWSAQRERQQLHATWPACSSLYFLTLTWLFGYLEGKPLSFAFELRQDLWPPPEWWLPDRAHAVAMIALTMSVVCLVLALISRQTRRPLPVLLAVAFHLVLAAASVAFSMSVIAIANIIAFQRSDSEPGWWALLNISVVAFAVAIPVAIVMAVRCIWRAVVAVPSAAWKY